MEAVKKKETQKNLSQLYTVFRIKTENILHHDSQIYNCV